ncbi:MAG: sugar transferase [Clostridia bacterium]|nr:sugar transferase [Clostridia bacterium]
MKRFFDIIISLFGLIILSPLLALTCVVIFIDDGLPVVFRQKRVGRNSKLFTIYKFRTMKKGTRSAATGELSESDEQITKSGRVLRKTSVDELLQLVNVLNGTMSIVGPRPLIPEEKEIHALRERYGVYKVRPGVTGWAQINGRDALDDETKALYDKEYVEKQSLLFDIKILLKTVAVVLKRENITEGGEGK